MGPRREWPISTTENVYLTSGVKVEVGIPGEPPVTFALTVGAGAAMKMGGM